MTMIGSQIGIDLAASCRVGLVGGDALTVYVLWACE